MKRVVTGGLVVLLLAASPVLAARIDVGDHILAPNSPDEEIQIYVTAEQGDALLGGVHVRAQIADGGTEVGGSIDGPAITGLTVIRPGTVFGDVSNDGHSGGGSLARQIYLEQTITGNGQEPVLGDGMLAVLTIDTSGFTSGVYDLRLGDTLDGDTELLDNSQQVEPIPLTITNGSITIPEPSTVVMLLGVLAGAAVLFGKRRK